MEHKTRGALDSVVGEYVARTQTRADLVGDLVRLGVPRGGVMMVHSSLRSIGHVEGGAETVVDALLDSSRCKTPQVDALLPGLN